MVQKKSPKHEAECSGAAATACAAGATGSVPKASASRWEGKTTRARSTKADRDDWKKQKKIIKVDKYDEFNEWIDGDVTMRYLPKDIDARKHLSGWAMRNTNNHNKKVLKKSCLGVFLCSKGCRTSTGDVVTVRPATSDRARKKQADKKCPRNGCDGKLFHMICAGKLGYPVTHFWRVTDTVILFQSKGVHDHPRPDVVKTTSQAKMALLEYHRTHRHERPKEICKKVGTHIHKSFNRVDRVARQLREVQNSDIPEPGSELPKEHYSLRSHIRSLYSNGQRQTDTDNNPFVAGQGTFQNAYSNRQSYGNYYPPSQPQMDGWTHFTASQDDYNLGFQSYRQDGQHPSTTSGYQHQTGAYPYNPPLHSADGTTYDYGYDGSAVIAAAATSSGVPKGHNGVDSSGVHSDLARSAMPTYHNHHMDALGQILMSNQQAPMEMNPAVYGTTELISPSAGSYHPDTGEAAVVSPLKRPAPPDLHFLQDSIFSFRISLLALAGGLTQVGHAFYVFQLLKFDSNVCERTADVQDTVYSPFPAVQYMIAMCRPPGDRRQSMKEERLCSSVLQIFFNNIQAVMESAVASLQVVLTATDHMHHLHHILPFNHSQHSCSTQCSNQWTYHYSSPWTNEQDGNFLDQLVSMYLGKDEKPISTLKNELQVYTDPQSGQRTLTYRTNDQAHHGPALDHFRTPGHGGHHEGYSWYDRTQSYNSSNGHIPVTEGLISPLMAGHFDYTTSITDYYNSQQAAAAAAAAAASTESTLSTFPSTSQSQTTSSAASGTFSHSSRYMF
uniref:Glial cells missing n=1 Tax=Lytechinus variegatus TaxID=7654 RepID=A9YWQ5_LYTVA|nr:glial cells missing [Lytechinus variegatus]